jgi:hypothetical protein
MRGQMDVAQLLSRLRDPIQRGAKDRIGDGAVLKIAFKFPFKGDEPISLFDGPACYTSRLNC